MQPSQDLYSYIRERKYVLLDGALGTLLSDRGESLNPVLWSAGHLLSPPNCDYLRGLHREYFTAGADILTAASYQISFEGFERIGKTREDTVGAIQRAVSLPREAAATPIPSSSSNAHRERRCFVAGSIGCYGAHLCNGAEYHGNYDLPHSDPSDDYLCQWHRDKYHHLIHASPDVIAFETIPCLTEVKGILKLLRLSESERDGGRHDFQPPLSWISIACLPIKSSIK